MSRVDNYKLAQYLVLFVFLTIAIIFPLANYNSMSKLLLVVIEFIILGLMALVNYIFMVAFIGPYKEEIKKGYKLEHRGILTNKWERTIPLVSYSRQDFTQDLYLKLNDCHEIKIGNSTDLVVLKLYRHIQINKCYCISQSLRDPDLILNIEQIEI